MVFYSIKGTHTGINSPFSSLSIGPKSDTRNSSSPSPVLWSASSRWYKPLKWLRQRLTVKVTADDIMTGSIPGLLQLLGCTIHIQHLPLPFRAPETAIGLGIDAGGYAVEWVKGGDISERVVTDSAPVCTAGAPVVSGAG